MATQWRRVYLMVNCILANKTELTNQPSASQWSDYTSLHKILEPFENAITILGGTKYTISSSVLPLVAYLKQRMAAGDGDTSYVQEFKKVFYSQLTSNIDGIINCENLQFATALDIRYKRLLSMDKDKRANVWARLKVVTRKLIDADSGSRAPVAKKPKTSLLSLAGDEHQSLTEEDIESDICMSEFDMYTFLPQINDDDQCPLQWWSQNESTYPVLSKLARKYLAIPATSVPCEQLFSDAREQLIRKRAALLPDDVSTTLCLSDWLSFS